jgi:methylated-DNA-[protein]-cysteine S-methyltransferase
MPDHETDLYHFFYQSPIGWLKIEATDDYVTAIEYVEMPDTENNANHLTAKAQQQLQAYFEKKRTVFELPLQMQGTDFQKTVWNALLHIPFGKTISYLELSRRIGNEKAIRAVGHANGQNPLAIIVPCHRVIGSDGSLTGYGGGLWRKQWLLQHEGSPQQMELAF